jgi:hypothetical protein
VCPPPTDLRAAKRARSGPLLGVIIATPLALMFWAGLALLF